MIIVTSIDVKSYENGHPKTAIISASADSKASVTSGEEFVGLPEGCEILLGSSVITTDGDVAFMNSAGSWKWQ